MTPQPQLQDSYGRRFAYLRLSITEACNFKCQYCLPHGYTPTGAHQFLSRSEIVNLVTALAELGMWKIRLTGGEPTLRRDLPELIRSIRDINGVEHIALTTNGYRLAQDAQAYHAAGLNSINVSVDSLDPAQFAHITGVDKLAAVTAGINACQTVGLHKIKLNAVLLRSTAWAELGRFLDYVRHAPLTVRFIELMQTGAGAALFAQEHMRCSELLRALEEAGWQRQARAQAAGPALELAHPDYVGRIGFIAPYARDFCESCNRLRVSARGDLQMCLFGSGGHSIRHLLQQPDQKTQLQAHFVSLLAGKQAAHGLHEGNVGMRTHLASIGG